jgi:2-polyprenyl-6-methoxyphenol hydroxylase-like FAD-dependent oxidoreductase
MSRFRPAYTHDSCAKGDIGIWQLRDLPPLQRWAKGRVIIIGDAAHASEQRRFCRWHRLTCVPVLPHQASGALCAIEDAEALGAFLRGAARADVPAALQRVFRARFRRASEFQKNSRATGLYSASTGADGLVAQWEYAGAEAWESERPEMVLKEDVDAEQRA